MLFRWLDSLHHAIQQETDDFFTRCRKILFVVSFVCGIYACGYLLYDIYFCVYYPNPAAFTILCSGLFFVAALFGGYAYAWKTKTAPDSVLHLYFLLLNFGFILIVVSTRQLPWTGVFFCTVILTMFTQCPKKWIHIAISTIGFLLNNYEQTLTPLGYPALTLPGAYGAYTVYDVLFRVIVVIVGCGLVSRAVHMQTVEFRRLLLASQAASRMSKAVALKLLDYDTMGASAVLKECRAEGDVDIELIDTFDHIARNLEAYRAYIPQALLEQINDDGDDDDDDDNEVEMSSSKLQPDLLVQDAGGTLDVSSVIEIPMSDIVAPSTPTSNNKMRMEGNTSPLSHRSRGGGGGVLDPTDRPIADVDARIMDDARVSRLTTLGFKAYNGTLLTVQLKLHRSKGNPQYVHEQCQLFVSIFLRVIEQNDGVVLSLNGDRVVASWNSFRPCALHPSAACKAALELRSDLACLTTEFHIVVTSGVVLVGFVGTSTRKSPVVLGDPVELMYPLTEYGAIVKSAIIITESVHRKVFTSYNCVVLDVLQLRGVAQEMKVYELISSTLVLPQMEFEQLNESYNAGFSRFMSNSYALALASFVTFLKTQQGIADARHTEQALRLGRLCSYFQDSPKHNVPAPYVRNQKIWDDYEAIAYSAKKELPESLKPYAQTRSLSFSTSASTFVTPSKSLSADITQFVVNNNIDILHLRDQVVAANQSAPPSSSGSSDAQTKQSKSALYTNFVATNGVRYHRSDKLLGRGATAKVYLGLQDDGSFVALKFVKIPESNTKLEGILQEVEVLQKLRHDDIVSFLSTAIIGQYLIIITEYVSGGTLSSALESFSKIPLPTLKRYLIDILHGLDYLHSNGIIHRDIKPANALLMIDGQCKLTDFGAAAILSQTRDGSDITGTPLYMAPEACRGHAVKASDIWSFGVMTVELMTGFLPWTVQQRGTPFVASSFVHRVAHEEAMVPALPKEVVGAAKNFVEKCLNRDPAKRPTAAELLRDPFLL